jgi:hypothetical protein
MQNPQQSTGLLPLTSKQYIYAVVDACQAFDFVCQAKDQFGRETRTLFEGAAAGFSEVAEIAPYLFAFDAEDPLLTEWFERLGTNTGILIVSDASLRDIRKHLRQVFIARDQTNQEFFFRFYDPRVLRGFLPACNSEEIKEFFGPIHWFVVEDIAAQALVLFSQSENQLSRTSLPASLFRELITHRLNPNI